ncbi:hypothetical protein IMSAGC012_03452 [Lachnospiraceae bacterium]|nr:hypothetical protein IMSAGC012_03452 [Lachnospiraceae bacterium]GFI33000.1 hypothetical protein IMSAGC013_04407 [Lachnospiraceae bacterium]
MAKDYHAIHYIQNQAKKYHVDDKLSDLLIRGFNLIYNIKEADGCASNSVALYICLKNMGYNPQVCYGLCTAENGFCFYHMWIELEGKVIDLAIYGNAKFSFLGKELADVIETPIVLETYDETKINYGKFLFDDDWKYAGISAVENMTLKEYIINAPNNCMKKLICRYMDESPTTENINKLLDNIDDFRFTDLKRGD